jgi:hypothetical protein
MSPSLAQTTNPIVIETGSVAPPVIQLAVACGLLQAVAGEVGLYELNPGWFTDPVGQTGAGLANNADTLALVIAQLIGQASGSSLGIPAKEPGSLGTWYPINKPGTDQPSGLYLATQPVSNDGNAGGAPSTVFGLGVMYTKTVELGSAPDAASGPSTIALSAWGLIPLAELGNGTVAVVAGQAGHPFTMGFQVTGGSGKLVDTAGISFDGVRLSVDLSPAASPPVAVSLVVTQLALPTDPVPKDRTLADLEAITGAELLATAASLAVAALGKVIGDQASLPYLLPALGLGAQVPGVADVLLPILRWDSFVELAMAGGNLAQPFVDWFTALASTDGQLSAWLLAVGGAVGGVTGTSAVVSGAGTRAAPFSVPVFAVSGIGTLALTAGSLTDTRGVRHFYPGLRFAAKPFALGSSGTEVTGAAALELLDFPLALGGTVGVRAGNFQAGITLSGAAGAPLFEGTVLGADYRFGAFAGGMAVLTGDAGTTVQPAFTLIDVQTASGQYASIDLTQPGQIVNAVEADLNAAVGQAFNLLFGVGTDSVVGPALAALIGVLPPLTGGVAWPSTLVPPFSVAGLVHSIQFPVAAMSDYYAALIRAPGLTGGQPPFFYMLQALGTVLQQTGGTTGAVTGTGSQADPWLMPIGATGSYASVLAFITPANGGAVSRLILGIGVATTMPIVGNTLQIALRLEALGLDAGAASGGLQSAQILPGIGAYLALTDGFTTPAVAGAQLQIAAGSFSLVWSPYSSWAWSMSAAAPALIVDGVAEPVGTDMTYSNATALEDLVRDQAATFGAILTGVLGIALYRAQQRGGLALSGWFGLLPNLGPFIPAGVTWPSTMPVLRPASFDDPIGQVRAQLKAVLGTPAQAVAALGLLGWAIDGKASTAAAISGTGTQLDPYQVPLGLPWDVLLTLCQDSGQSFVAPGFSTRQTATLGGVTAVTTVALSPLALDWATGTFASTGFQPQIDVSTILSAGSGPLWPGGPVATVTLGFALRLDLSGASPVFAGTPVIAVTYVAVGGVTPPPLILTPDISAPSLADLMGLVNSGINAAASAFAGNETFQLIYATLTELGLAVPAVEGKGPYGVDPGGWLAMMSAPVAFLSGRLLQVLAVPALRTGLFQAVADTLGFTLPTIPAPLLALLAGLGITTDAEHGYAANPQAIIAIARAPASQLSSRLAALVANPAARSAVVASLAGGTQRFTFGPFTLATDNGRTLALSLPRGGLTIGAFVFPSFTGRVDVETGVLTGSLDLYIPDARFSLMSTLSYSIGGAAPVVTESLRWGDGVLPQPASMVLWPFNPTAFIDQLAATAPAYVLAMIVAGVTDSGLLAKYPLACTLLQAFGLAEPDPVTGVWQMKSALGLFEDPLGWLLSDAVVGAGGRLNITQVQKMLLALPPGTAAGLTLATVSNGVTLSGLPYDLCVSATADPATGLFALTPAIAAPLPLLASAELAAFQFGLTLTADYQPGLSGTARLTATIPGLSQSLFVQGGYDKGFALSIGESGAGNPALSLVPFGGWQTFVLQVASQIAQTLLQSLTQTLLDGLAAKGDAQLTAFVTNLRSTAATLDVGALVNALIAAQPDGGKLEAAALEWLSARLQPGNATATATAVAGLLNTVLTGVASQGGLVTYAPSSTVPITILAGVRTDVATPLLGIWASLSISAYDAVFITLSPTGVGVPVTGTPLPVVAFGFNAQAVIALGQGPGLAIGFDGSQITASFDPMMTNGVAGPLSRALLPDLFSVAPGPGYDTRLQTAVTGWLLDILQDVLPRYVSVVVLNTGAVTSWLNAPLFPSSPLTAGQLLTGSQLLVLDQGRYVLASVQSLETLGVAGFLAGFLKTLTQTQIQVLSFPDGGGIWLEPGPGTGDYGVRFAVTGLSLASVPYLVFQLGAKDTEWMSLAGVDLTAFQPGIAAYVPINGAVPDFGAIKLRLINIGVDFRGKAGQPLVDFSRFQLASVQPRGLLTFDFSQSNPIVDYGGGIDITGIAISLAPNALTPGTNANPVAQNLLGSGNQATQANPAANPAFSAVAGWYSGGHLGAELYDDSGTGATRIWFPVQRSFGPVHANKIGLGWDNPSHVGSFLFDGNLTLAGLSVDLIDLSVSVNVTEITDYSQYSLDLGGLSITFSGGAVELQGGLLKQENPLRYDGQLLVKAASFTIYAVGSFALIPTDPSQPDGDKAVSFFVFLNLNAPLGGVPAFFVNGIAGGFSVNRNIIVPDAGDIMSFPLIQGAISQSTFGADPTPASALAVLSDTVYPDIGSFWAAAGIKFTSFQLVDVFAMLLLKFGREWEIDVIGVASASLPPQVPVSSALAYVELGLVASFKITEGEISVTAQLTPNSFLLAQACKLTGGFAAKYWFGSNPHAGDFVITLGGYNPAFEPPDYYPSVPRLGFSWPVLDTAAMSVSVSGGTYFALTPSMVMAGGFLKASFNAGPLKAWFDASADFLIAWQPFYFSAGIRISVGISFGCEIAGVSVTLTAELGASLALWGPPTAGEVNVNWYVISFTIPFGDTSQDKASTQPLSWEAFAARMLPPPAAAPAPKGLAAAALAVTPAEVDQVVLGIQVTSGLLAQDGDFGPVLQSAPFTVQAQSVMPASGITISQSSFSVSSPSLGITPMNLPDVQTPVVVTLEAEDDGGVWSIVSVDRPGLSTVAQPAPAVGAMWSPVAFNPNGVPTASMIDGAMFGVVIAATADQVVDPLAAMDLLTSFGYEQAPALNLPFSGTPSYPVPAELAQTGRYAVLMGTVMQAGPVAARQAIMQTLEDSMVAVLVDQDLSILAAFADQIFQAAPSLAPLGFDMAGNAQGVAAAPVARAVAPPVAAPVRPPALLAMTQAYAPAVTPAMRAMAVVGGAQSILLASPRVTARWSDRGARVTAAPATALAVSGAGGDVSLAVRPGVIAVLDTGSGPGTARLSLTARPTPVRAYAFDDAGRVLSDVVYAAGEEAMDAPLPDAASQMALIGLGAGAGKPAVAGWNTHTTLFQLGQHTLLGSGCTVRLQAGAKLPKGMRERARGPIEGGAALRQNLVQTGVGRTRPGWVETVFGQTVGTVAVLLAKGAPADVHVQITATDSPWTTEYGAADVPVRQINAVDGTILLFETPSVPGTDRHAVLVRGVAGLAGVYGFADDPAAVASGWGGYDLPAVGRVVRGAGPVAATARLSRAQ